MSNYISKKILQQVSTEKTTQILLGQPAAQRQRFIQQGEKKNLSKVLAARRISKAWRRDALIAAQHSIQNRIAETVPAFYPIFNFLFDSSNNSLFRLDPALTSCAIS